MSYPADLELHRLQAMIDSQPRNGKLTLPPGEYFGQVIIDRPLTIEGHGKKTWIGSKKSPVVKVTCPGVILRNFMVEVTEDTQGITVEAREGTLPVLEDVIRREAVKGIPNENILKTQLINLSKTTQG